MRARAWWSARLRHPPCLRQWCPPWRGRRLDGRRGHAVPGGPHAVRSATRAREPPLADADGQPRCAAAKLRCSRCRAWEAHATDGAGGPSAIKMGDNESRLPEPGSESLLSEYSAFPAVIYRHLNLGARDFVRFHLLYFFSVCIVQAGPGINFLDPFPSPRVGVCSDRKTDFTY